MGSLFKQIIKFSQQNRSSNIQFWCIRAWPHILIAADGGNNNNEMKSSLCSINKAILNVVLSYSTILEAFLQKSAENRMLIINVIITISVWRFFHDHFHKSPMWISWLQINVIIKDIFLLQFDMHFPHCHVDIFFSNIYHNKVLRNFQLNFLFKAFSFN